MPRPSVRLTTVLLLAAALGATATGATAHATPDDDNPFAELGLPEVAITVTENALEGAPSELAAGRYVLAVTNAVQSAGESETAGAAFLRVPDDVTADQLLAQLTPAATETTAAATPSAPAAESVPEADDAGGGPPPWYYQTDLAGGPYATPGRTGYAVVDLAAGEWILWTEDTESPQAPVVVAVTGEAPEGQPAPAADVRIEMSEFAFAFEPEISPGPQVVELANVGEQPHFLFMGRVPDGTGVEDAIGLFESLDDPTATAPMQLGLEDVTEAMSTGDHSAGTTAWYPLDVEAGTYVLACFLTDPATGTPHAMLGMTQIIVVE